MLRSALIFPLIKIFMRELGVTIIILDCLSINFLLRNAWFTCNVLLFYEITFFLF